MGRAARFNCNICSRAFTLEFFEQNRPDERGICLFCEVKQTVRDETVEALHKENRDLKAEIEKLRKLINGTEPHQHVSSHNTHVSSHNRNPPTNIPPPPGFRCPPPPGFHSPQFPTSITPPPPFRLVNNNNRPRTLPTSNPVTTTNRFNILRDELGTDNEG